MNIYVTGTTIKQLRERRNMTQAELAEKINVSSKTVSKWETAKGLFLRRDRRKFCVIDNV